MTILLLVMGALFLYFLLSNKLKNYDTSKRREKDEKTHNIYEKLVKKAENGEFENINKKD
ncbi:hypothetical protein JXA84_03950 [candidate division WOR-3 bacterium]|nr:hypothetical protein [candidate division WOR-3 bacterium]